MATAEEVSRSAGQAAERVVSTALRLSADLPAVSAKAATAGRGVLDAIRHPDDLADYAKKLQMAAPMLRQAATPLLTGQVDWQTEYAYTAGVQAFIYGFPYIYNAKIRHDWVTQPRDPAVVPYAAVNHFWHASQLMDASYRDGGCPNNDTLYSLAWLDLTEEPVILSHPDMGDRYFTFELMAFTSDNIDYVGQRTTGSKAGNFAVTGPGWRGTAARWRQGDSARADPVGPGTGPHPHRRRRGPGRRARTSGAVPADSPEPVGHRPGGSGTPRRVRPRRGASRSPRAVEDPERDAGGEPAARVPCRCAQPVRARRHRARPGRGGPAR